MVVPDLLAHRGSDWRYRHFKRHEHVRRVQRPREWTDLDCFISLLTVAAVQGSPEYALMIFAALAGCSLGLYYFNRFPARVFIGDIGTLGLGAAIGAGAIFGHIEFYGIIAIAPAFYEAIATFYYGLRGENGRRRDACHNPVILPDGRLQPVPGAGRYTLANFILSKRPMTERNLVRVLLGLYGLTGAVAILLSGV